MTSGAGYLLRGFGLWRRRPGLMLLGMIPALLVFAVLATAFVVLLLRLPDLVGWLSPFVDDASDLVRTVVRVGLALALVLGSLALAASTFVGVTLAVGDPFYARIWRETELMLGGPVPDAEVGAWRAVRDGLVLVLGSALAGLLVVVAGFLPLVGALLGAVLGLVVGGWLLARDLLGRPLEARGLDAAARADLSRGQRGTVLAFGIAVQLSFLVPLGAVLVMPAAVAGATMLARDLVADGAQTRV